jgi:amidase
MRRAIVAAAAVAAGLAACGPSVTPETADAQAAPFRAACLDGLRGIDLQSATVPELQRAVAKGRLTTAALVDLYLQRIAVFDTGGPKLNSVRALAPDLAAQAAARHTGPLAGVPVLLKDNIGTTDMPTTAGSIALELNVPKHEATIVTKLRDAGAIVMGKTNLSEFANWVDLTMPNGYSSLGGQVIAPYDFESDPYGSSTGSGVAATMAFATLAIGTETSGSIISPSFVHSDVGVKPTLGLVSRYGIIPLAPSFDTAGPIARNVTDAAILLAVIAGVDPNDPVTERFAQSELKGVVPDYAAGLSAGALRGARLGVRSGDAGSDAALDSAQAELGAFDVDAHALFQAALDVLRAQGAEIVALPDPVSASIASSSDVSLAEIPAIPNEFKWSLNEYLATEAGDAVPVETLTDIILFNQQHPDKVKYGQSLLIASNATTGTEFDPVYIASREAARAGAGGWIDTMIDQNDLDAIVGPDFSNISSTAAAGYPNVTVPMGYVGQAPHGLSFAGKPFTEARLLALAYAFEQATHLRRPPTDVNPELAAFCPP